jgi:hypothetical protein
LIGKSAGLWYTGAEEGSNATFGHPKRNGKLTELSIYNGTLRCYQGTRGSNLQRLLTQEQDAVLQRERSMLEELRLLLARLHAAEADLALLKASANQMQELSMPCWANGC